MSSVTQTDQPENVLVESGQQQSLQDYVRNYFRRIVAGDFGILPIVFGLIVIAAIFQSLNSNYLTPRNFVNLILQMAGIATIGYGIVFVLLLGQIDLSVSYVSAVGGVSLVVMMSQGIPLPGLEEPWLAPWWFAIPAALLVTTVIGFFQGFLITLLDVPALIVTLAGFLAWNGVVLLILGEGGMIFVSDPVVTGIANSYLPAWASWGVLMGGVIAFAALEWTTARRRNHRGLVSKPNAIIAFQTIGLGILGAMVVYVCNLDRGFPTVGVLLLLMLFVLTFIAKKTPFGRYVYAVGDNRESARRAGINVNRVRQLVFTLAGLMSGMGGIILVSRLRSVSTGAGGGDLLLEAIAAAVIGGTSLFGGRGFVGSALLGAIVIASVNNGMGLLNYSSGVKFVVTGVVLLLAVTVDALSRRRQREAGIV